MSAVRVAAKNPGKEMNTMARQKRHSNALENNQKRLSGLEAIDEALDLGNGLSVVAFNLLMDELDDMVDAYNTKLADTDASATLLQSKEKEVTTLGKRLMKGVAARYDTDSLEYEKAGGIPDSKRKRPVRKPKPEGNAPA